MSTTPLSLENAPHGASAPSEDFQVIAANPGSDVELTPAARSFLVLTSGTVTVRTVAGNDRTFEATAGMGISTAISAVLTGTTSELLVYTR